ncbi:MAG: hypothetical protein IT447_11285 [Phycisphaerales bacterium]|jgi:hypothetical protein|nr:hypothetical protein [Phycisphaerales bacterium]
MDRTLYICPNDPAAGPESTLYSARIDCAGDAPLTLQYAVANAFVPAITDAMDSFLVGVLFKAMKKKTPIHVHGRVSPSLLRNLTEFQDAWHHYRPELYTQVPITADLEAESASPAPDKYVSAFSGGADAAFTLYRHCKKLCGRLARPIGAAVMVHGFDIPLSQKETFARASARAQALTDDLGVPLARVATNWRIITPEEDWEHMHGSALAAVLLLFQKGFRGGQIASGNPYSKISNPWGSSPLMDWRLGGLGFTIEHDAAAFDRYLKIKTIAQWPAGRRGLRICYEGADLSRNCGVCYKCLRSILLFRAVGAGLPECFAQDVDDQFIRDWHRRDMVPNAATSIREILSVAKMHGTDGSWTVALKASLDDRLKELARPMWYRKFREQVGLRTRIKKILGLGQKNRQSSNQPTPPPTQNS